MSQQGDYAEITVRVPHEENEPLGARPNDRLVVTAVQKNTAADGHLQQGDIIQSVNGRPVKTLADFYRLISAADPIATIVLRRARTQSQLPPEVKPSTDPGENLPPEIALAITRRSGHEYRLVKIPRVQGKRFGVTIKTRNNRVIVCALDAGSMCEGLLKPLDHLIYINGTRVTQADVAQLVLVRGMKEKGFIECVIGRPISPDASQAAQQELSRAEHQDPPSVRLAPDVQEVMQKQIRSAISQKPGTGILSKPGQPPSRRVSIGNNHQVFRIVSDHPGRPMRIVNPNPNSPFRQQ